MSQLVSQQARNETVVLYPSFGRFDAQAGVWRIQLAGNIYEPGPDGVRRRMLIRLLRRVLRLPAEAIHSDLFRDRIGGFLVVAVQGRRLLVQIGDREFQLRRPSKRNGHFRESISLSADELQQADIPTTEEGGWLTIHVKHDRPEHTFRGQTQLIGPQGLSVVSDIDDTIKLTNVGDRKAMLMNTFFREFEPITEMAKLYRHWAEMGARFHYVSSSPWQLYEALSGMIESSGFPAGSYHLRNVRLRDASLLRLFVARRLGKRRIIQSVIASFPMRRFLLVGDSGEKDPEIYGYLARRFPAQVAAILIRRTDGRSQTDERFEKAFQGIPPSKCHVFSDPSELSENLEHCVQKAVAAEHAH